MVILEQIIRELPAICLIFVKLSKSMPSKQWTVATKLANKDELRFKALLTLYSKDENKRQAVQHLVFQSH